MGKAFSFLTRPIRTFNIENRAGRVIAKSKPIRAPEYPSAEKQREIVDNLYPNFIENHYKKNVPLDKRLKEVYVVSNDPEVKLAETEEKKLESKRALPQTKYYTPEFEFGFYEPITVLEGRCTLRQALIFITKYKEDPIVNSIDNIAREYKMDKLVVENILKHFKLPRIVDKNEESAEIKIIE